MDDEGDVIALFMRPFGPVPERLAWLSGAVPDVCCLIAARRALPENWGSTLDFAVAEEPDPEEDVAVDVFVRVLGGFEVVVDGRPVADGAWRHRRGSELVKLLALAGRRRLPRDRVLDALWPELDVAAAARNLHKAAHYARGSLGIREGVMLRGGHVALLPDATVTIDADRFESEALLALAGGSSEACGRAARLYAGVLLPDDPYAEWTLARRERLRGLQLALLKGAGLWEQALAEDPLDEEAHRGLIADYVRRGNRQAAVYQYQHLREVLRREIGLAPSSETVDLYRRLVLDEAGPNEPVSPPVQYVQSQGGVSIAYQVVGSASVDLLMIPGWISHLGLDWEEPTWVRFCGRLTSFARLIRFDKRGTGLSDRPSGVPMLEERMEDARAVLDAVEARRVHVLGWSEGGPLAILLAIRHPERVRSLVLYGTQACGHRLADYPWGDSAEEVREQTRLILDEWGSLDLAGLFAPHGDARFARQFAAYMRAGASPSAAAALNEANHAIDVRALLREVSVPTLILNRPGDPIAPLDSARYMAERIAGARLQVLEGDDHVMWVGDTDELCGEIESFVRGVERSRTTQHAAAASG